MCKFIGHDQIIDRGKHLRNGNPKILLAALSRHTYAHGYACWKLAATSILFTSDQVILIIWVFLALFKPTKIIVVFARVPIEELQPIVV